MVKARRFSSKIRNKTRMSTIAIFIQHSTISPSQSNQTKKKKRKKERKGIQTEKEEVKLSLFAQIIISYIEKPKDSITKLLMNSVELQDIKSTLKNQLFLYTDNKLPEREINNNFIYNSIKYKSNLTKEVKDLYSENCKTLSTILQ